MTSGDADQSGILAKIRALLAKAESTTFEAEAEALTAKAQELMTRHAIDEAFARASGGTRSTPAGREVLVEDPYANPKSSLLFVCAGANGVRAVWSPGRHVMTLIGFDGDVDAVLILSTSLVIQASRALVTRGQVRDERGRSRTRSYRSSFYLSFAQRIGERLREAASTAERVAAAELGDSVLPVLAGRQREVDAAVARMFPRLGRARSVSVTNPEGWAAGRRAADAASLGPERSRLSSAR